ncbi:MAG: Sec-independent protein translocase protein TatB [Acidaminococcaceae bacterium]|nr:Sec-independent protein translocase protein TatB [Acidaminococcaceae bacterium]
MSIGFGEILMILCVAFFVVGPKDMPKVAKTLARGVKKLRQMMRSVTEDFEDELQLEEANKGIASANEEFKRVQEKVNELNSVIKE